MYKSVYSVATDSSKAIGCSPSHDGKTILLNTQLTYVIKHRENDLVPNQQP